MHVVENGTKTGIAINPVVCQIKALKTKNIVYNISKGKHSMIHLICIGDFYRAPIPQTFSYFIRKIMRIYENYKELSPVFGEITIPDCFLNAEMQ